MAQKQSILSRISTLAKANINAILDRAEDPQKMIDQMIRDYTNSIAEAEQAVAQTIGNLRMLEEDVRNDQEQVQSWGQKALAASQRADQFRKDGDDASADKFDNLAKVALERQMTAERSVQKTSPGVESQREVVERLKNGLTAMKNKREQLVTKRDELVARSKSVQAQATMHDAMKSIDVLDPTSEVSRFEEKVRREEARVRGMNELAADSLDAQFEQLEDLGDKTEVEARLAALKSGRPTPQLNAGAEKTDDEMFAELEEAPEQQN